MEGVAVGCVFYAVGDDYLYFHRLAVLPAYRRQGIGRALITYVEDRARALDIPRVRLATRMALTQNRLYYARLGYQEVEVGEKLWQGQPFYVVMEKTLAASCVPLSPSL